MTRKFVSLLPLLTLTSVLLAGFFVAPSALPEHVLCPFKLVFHLDCPGCGLTRAFLLIPRGHIKEALALNASSVVVYLLLVSAFVRLILQKVRPLISDHFVLVWFQKVMIGLALVLMGAHWVYKMAHAFFLNLSLTF